MDSIEHQEKIKQEKIKLKKQQEKKRKIIVYAIVAAISSLLIFLFMPKSSNDKETSELEIPESEVNVYNTKLEALNQGSEDKNEDVSIFDMFDTQEEKDTTSIEIEDNKLKNKLDSLSKTNNTKKKKSYKSNSVSYSYKKKKKIKIPEKKINQDSIKAINDAKRIDRINKRRILLTTGLSSYEESKSINAKILSNGMIKSGQTVTLVTTEDCFLSFQKIPKGKTITGIVSIGTNRLNIHFSTLRIKNKIIKIDLDLFSSDGLKGLPIDNDEFLKDQEDTAVDEITQNVSKLGKFGNIVNGVIRSKRRSKQSSIFLSKDIECLLINKNL